MVAGTDRIAIIPARGGSKRIPHKNVVDFGGQPMIAHTIRAARDSGVFGRVVVSTDDEDIAAISRSYGAEVPFLRRRFADDHSTVSQVIVATLERLGLTTGTVAMLMANCPLREAATIRDLYALFEQRDCDFQLSAFAYGHANPWWAHRTGDDGRAEALFDNRDVRSQDLPALLCPTGACWLARVPALLKAGTFYGPDYRFGEIDWLAAMDIDVVADLELARLLLSARPAL